VFLSLSVGDRQSIFKFVNGYSEVLVDKERKNKEYHKSIKSNTNFEKSTTKTQSNTFIALETKLYLSPALKRLQKIKTGHRPVFG